MKPVLWPVYIIIALMQCTKSECIYKCSIVAFHCLQVAIVITVVLVLSGHSVEGATVYMQIPILIKWNVINCKLFVLLPKKITSVQLLSATLNFFCCSTTDSCLHLSLLCSMELARLDGLNDLSCVCRIRGVYLQHSSKGSHWLSGCNI